MRVEEIARISESGKARDLLLEIKRHADPLLAARGWYVKRLIEMCCCEKKNMGANLGVAGWCRAEARGKGAAVIAIRLRHPRSHELYPLDQCLSVMWHEIAHITFSSHSADFYSLIEDIRSHYELIKRKGLLPVDKSGFPITGGRSTRNGSRSLTARTKRTGLAAAEKRRRIASKSSVLGGASRPIHKSAVEAAAAAAIQRAKDARVGLGDEEEAVASAVENVSACPVCGSDSCLDPRAHDSRNRIDEDTTVTYVDLTRCDDDEPPAERRIPPRSPIDLTQEDNCHEQDRKDGRVSSSKVSSSVAMDAEIAEALAREEEAKSLLPFVVTRDFSHSSTNALVAEVPPRQEFNPFVSSLNGVQNFRPQRRRRV